jgi:transposase-like protein
MLRVVEKPTKENEGLRTTLDELLQRDALKMLHEALEAEVEEYVTRHREACDGRGRAQVVRNGKAPARTLVTGSGTLEVRAPRVSDRRVGSSGRLRQANDGLYWRASADRAMACRMLADRRK